MSVFVVERRTAMSAAEAWERVTDWSAHAAGVPLTRARTVTPGPPGLGSRFVVRTGVGRLGVDDPMEVVRWEPPSAGRPGVCRLAKRGRVVLGRAEITVYAEGSGARVVWEEALRLRGLPRLFDPALRRAGRLLFGRALAGVLAEEARAQDI
ncbi:hypothetical protein [Streptomyces purpureus]|nr:hypothetical protein [Streptomyces purpureus]